MMSSSRNQRKKKEGTFLESVRDALEALRRDVADIKTELLQLGAAQTNFCYMDAQPYSDYYSCAGDYFNWNCNMSEDVLTLMRPEGISTGLVDSLASKEIQSNSMLQATVESHATTFTRDMLLNYRLHAELATPCDFRFSTLSVQTARRFELPRDLRKIPEDAWEAIYDRFRDESCSQSEASQADCLCEDDLEIVWLPFEEFKRRLVPAMQDESIQRNYSEGLRDFDEGIWYKILLIEEGSTDVEKAIPCAVPKLWNQEEMTVWYHVTCRKLEACDSMNAISEVIERRWTEARHHIPPEVQPLFLQGFDTIRAGVREKMMKRTGEG